MSSENVLETLKMEYNCVKQKNTNLCEEYVRLQTVINNTGKYLTQLNCNMKTGFKRTKCGTGMVSEIARHRPQSITSDSQVHLLQQQIGSLQQTNQKQEDINNRLKGIIHKTADFLKEMQQSTQEHLEKKTNFSGEIC